MATRLAPNLQSEFGLILLLKEFPQLLIKEGWMLDHGRMAAVGEEDQSGLKDLLFE
jgi:hypothetical protein